MLILLNIQYPYINIEHLDIVWKAVHTTNSYNVLYFSIVEYFLDTSCRKYSFIKLFVVISLYNYTFTLYCICPSVQLIQAVINNKFHYSILLREPFHKQPE